MPYIFLWLTGKHNWYLTFANIPVANPKFVKTHLYVNFSVEELECLATWKEGSLRFLVGKLHHNHATSNEDRYRCFVYEKTNGIGKIVVALFIIISLFISFSSLIPYVI